VAFFELDSVLLTEGSIIDPCARDLGVASLVFIRDPQLLSGRWVACRFSAPLFWNQQATYIFRDVVTL